MKNQSYFAVLGLSIFLKFFWGTPNYTLSIWHSLCPLATWGTWNIKIIESLLDYELHYARIIIYSNPFLNLHPPSVLKTPCKFCGIFLSRCFTRFFHNGSNHWRSSPLLEHLLRNWTPQGCIAEKSKVFSFHRSLGLLTVENILKSGTTIIFITADPVIDIPVACNVQF